MLNEKREKDSMKKTVIISTLVMVFAIGITSVLASEYTKFSSAFIKKFKDCDYYEETTHSEFEGNTFSTNRKIIGWKNGFCKYQEIIKSKEGNYQLDCLFSSLQVDDIYYSMKDKSKTPESYELEMFGEQKDPKTGKIKYIKTGTTTIKGNKAYITWAKYQNNPYFCKPQKLSK